MGGGMKPGTSLPRLRAAVEELRRQSPEPVCAYIYDLQALVRHVRWMRSSLPAGCELYYAAKANAEAPVLAALAPWVDGFEAASGGELAWLRRCRIEQPMLLGGPGKLDSDLEAALTGLPCTIHVESTGELERLSGIASRCGATARLCLRVNLRVAGLPGTRLTMGGTATPFGMDEEDLPVAIDMLRRHRSLRLEGFHFHLMSHQCDADRHVGLVQACLDAAHRWRRAYGLDIGLVNVGGGFGVDYTNPEGSFDWERFCAGLRQVLAARRETLQLRFEPGRFVTAACGWYVMEVLDIKRSHGRYFAVARGGTHHFRTPAAQGHDHPFVVMRGNRPPCIRRQRVTLVGQLCTPKDVLAREQPVDALATGDCLAFPLAGAYAWNISHQNFLMHPPPRMLYLSPDLTGAARSASTIRSGEPATP